MRNKLLSFVVVFCTAIPYAIAAAPPGYAKVWEDTFDGTALDVSNWTIGCDDPGTGDRIPGAGGQYLLNNKYDSYITSEDVYVTGGNLYLQNQKRSYTGTSPSGNYNYTTGWIMSMHKVYFNKGYVEFRAQFPSGDKVWPALWLIAEDLVWGPEWDMWEYFGYRSDVGYDIMGNHLMTGPWDSAKWDSYWLSNFDVIYDCESWHVYGFEWTDTQAVWSIDGVVVHTLLKSASRDPAAWPNEDMYFVLNNSTKSASPDTNTTWPNYVVIDYVELYKYQTDTIAPVAPTGLTATAGNSSISLDWDDNAEPDLWTYGVYSSEIPGGPYTYLSDTPTSNYVDSGLTNGTTYYYVVTAIDTSANESDISNEASETPDESLPLNNFANSEIPVFGTVSGSYADTTDSDDVYESITEIQSSGNPSDRYSYLEHKWTIGIPAGDTVAFYVEAYQSASSDGDNFVFAYSTDDSSYTDMLTVTKTSDDNTTQSYVLPADTSGTVYIRVKDTDQTAGSKNRDTINIDQMYIQTSSADINPPAAPTGLVATAGVSSVTLDWADNGESDLAGYNVYRSTTSGGSYTQIFTGLGVSNYNDNTADYNTVYYYIVTAVDTSSNESGDSNEASIILYRGDLTRDGKVDMGDVAELGAGWLTSYDLNTLLDIADNWLYGISP